jgi:hypothetical protein
MSRVFVASVCALGMVLGCDRPGPNNLPVSDLQIEEPTERPFLFIQRLDHGTLGHDGELDDDALLVAVWADGRVVRAVPQQDSWGRLYVEGNLGNRLASLMYILRSSPELLRVSQTGMTESRMDDLVLRLDSGVIRRIEIVPYRPNSQISRITAFLMSTILEEVSVIDAPVEVDDAWLEGGP